MTRAYQQALHSHSHESRPVIGLRIKHPINDSCCNMANALNALLEKHFGDQPLPRLKRLAIGLAEDFWHDGDYNPFTSTRPAPKKRRKSDTPPPASETPIAPPTEITPHMATPKIWHAEAGEISEKMWGAGFVTPGDAVLNDMMMTPLGLTKDHSVLDLSAGLGGRLRKTVEEFGVYITGLEPDPDIAARGMELSTRAGKAKRAEISAYDPASFSVARRYDCIIARETFYRVADRPTFFAALAGCTKAGAQISFTDYIVNPEDREKPAIVAWTEKEKCNPIGIVEMAEAWAKVGFKLRVHDDQTNFYKSEIKIGLKRLALFLATGPIPDTETKQAISRRLNTWVLRLGAMQSGMKFVRFYGSKM